MIAIIKGCGTNIASIQFALQRLKAEAILTDDPQIIQRADRVILPGVGTALTAMCALQQKKLVPVIQSLTQPVLGICLGMQLLYEYSEEGNVQTLGIIAGKIRHFPPTTPVVPHMGWDQLHIQQPAHPLLRNVAPGSYVYFVHSYFASVNANTLATTTYDVTIASCVAYNNFFATQFHPERSSVVGAQILKNFIEF